MQPPLISSTALMDLEFDLRPSPLITGTALATGGEDGQVKIWSRNGMLRSSLTQCESPVYCVVWGWDSDQICFCSGSSVTIRSCQSSQRQVTWKAHEGVVLKVDWSPINHMVVTGGEDCKYKVWGMCVSVCACGGKGSGTDVKVEV